jgi:tetratricopeptide (TPR) repeat protein
VGHDFVWDDRSILMPNLARSEGSRLGEILTSDFFHEHQEQVAFDYWRPLVVLSHLVEWSLFGERPAGYHAVNAVLHAATALLVFLLGLQALGRPAPALAAGLLFAVHPVHVEVVAWISGRSDLLLGLFLTLALASDWQADRTGRRRWQALALLGFAAALCSKESAAVFPALVAARALLLGPAAERFGERMMRTLRATLPSLLVLGAFLLIRYGLLDVVPPQGAAEPAQRLTLFWTWWSALWLYARLLVWPSDLSIVHDLPPAGGPWSWTVGGGVIVFAAAIWGALRLRRAPPGASYGLLVLLLGMAPLSNFLVPIASHRGAAFPVAERFLYAPSIGLCLFLGWLFMQALPRALSADAGEGHRGRDGPRAGSSRPRPVGLRRLIPPALLGLALLAAARSSAVRASDWQDEATLFAAAVQRSPRNAMAQLNYGTALVELARGEASSDARRALRQRALRHLEEAVALAPGNYRGHYDLANLYRALGRPEAAIPSLREALRLHPDLFQAMVNLGAILAQSGRPAEALEWLEKASRLRPDNLAVSVNRAHVLQMLGHPEQAIPLYRQALAADPGLVAARAGLDRALQALPSSSHRDGS